jgi:hypothetical protein
MLRVVQYAVLGSEQRGSTEHRKIRQSSLTNILRHIIKGQGSARTKHSFEDAHADYGIDYLGALEVLA